MTLSNRDRFKLIGGPYRMPKCKVGGWLKCQLRGRVKVVGISDATIMWPVVVTSNGGGRGLALCGDLVKAVRQESTKAIQHNWGVGANTVWTWRRTLGIDQNNKGTRQLRSRWWIKGGTGDAAEPGRLASLSSPERAAKIAEAKKGKPRPPHVAEMLRSARAGTKHTNSTKKKMSDAAKQRGAYPPAAGRPFSEEEDALLGTMPDKEVAQKIGRSAISVAQRRIKLGIESFRKKTRGW